jgi:3-hydroxyacyl-CoA dehydrogenase
MSQVTLTRDTLKSIFKANTTGEVQEILLNAVSDLMDRQGFVLNIHDSVMENFVSDLDVPQYNDTSLIEVINRTASGDESGKGFYLHRQGGNVTWYASPTKKGKAVRLVPVYTGSEAEQHLIDLGYTAL